MFLSTPLELRLPLSRRSGIDRPALTGIDSTLNLQSMSLNPYNGHLNSQQPPDAIQTVGKDTLSLDPHWGQGIRCVSKSVFVSTVSTITLEQGGFFFLPDCNKLVVKADTALVLSSSAVPPARFRPSCSSDVPAVIATTGGDSCFLLLLPRPRVLVVTLSVPASYQPDSATFNFFCSIEKESSHLLFLSSLIVKNERFCA